MKALFRNILWMTMLIYTALQPFCATAIEYKNLDSSAYNKAIEGIDYSETVKEKKEEKSAPSFNLSALPGIIKAIGIAVGIMLITWLIYQLFFILTNNPSSSRLNLVEEIHLNNLEQYIHEINLEQFLANALASNDYTAAIRVYYLMIIKSLSEKNKIQWKKGKTNQEYLNELQRDAIYNQFASNTLLYEKIWYGDLKLDYDQFEPIAAIFKNFLKQLNQENGLQ